MSEQERQIHQLYPERPGAGLEPKLKIIDAQPNDQECLSVNELAEVKRFESGLYAGKETGNYTNRYNLYSENDEPSQKIEQVRIRKPEANLESIWNIEVHTHEFNLDYLQTKDGKEMFNQVFGEGRYDQVVGKITGQKAPVDVSQILIAFLRDPKNYEEMSASSPSAIAKVEQLKQLEGDSMRAFEESVADQFMQSGLTGNGIKLPQIITIVRNPDELVRKQKGLKSLKKYYKQWKRKFDMESDESNSSKEMKAKKLVVGMYLMRVNDLLADVDRLAYMQDGHFRELQLDEVRGKQNDPQRYFARYDRYGNGAGRLLKGYQTVVSEEAERLLAAIEQKNAKKKGRSEMETFVYQGVDIAKLKSIKIDAATWKSWAEDVLERNGILSSQKTVDPSRTGRASDGKWQIYVDASAKQLSVSSKLGLIKVPPPYKRSVFSVTPAGAPAILDHELRHVYQHENKTALGWKITEKVGMDRSGILAEAGAVEWESQIQKEWFGIERDTSPHYLKAIKARLAGGNYVDCMKGFFESSVDHNLLDRANSIAELARTGMLTSEQQKMFEEIGEQIKAQVKTAANRTLRIFRDGGVLDVKSSHLTKSQPLVYLEQELLASTLRERQAAATNTDNVPNSTKLWWLSGVNIDIITEMHKLGMIDWSKVKVYERPTVLIADKIKEHIAGQLNTSAS